MQATVGTVIRVAFRFWRVVEGVKVGTVASVPNIIEDDVAVIIPLFRGIETMCVVIQFATADGRVPMGAKMFRE